MKTLPSIGLYLPPSISRQLGSTVDHLVFEEEPEAGDRLVVSQEGVVGVVKFVEPASMVMGQTFDQMRPRHGVQARLRKAWFGDKSRLWVKEVESFVPFAEPIPVDVSKGTRYGEMFHVKQSPDVVELPAESVPILRRVQELSVEWNDLMPRFPSDLVSKTTGATRSILLGLPGVAEDLAVEMERFRIPSTRKAAPRIPWVVARELLSSVEELSSHVPAEADVLKRLVSDTRLTTTLVLGLEEVLKASFPGLKVPDPVYLLDRLEDGEKAGILSSVPRKERVGTDQVLLNELRQKTGTPEVYGRPFAWGVVRSGSPVGVKLEDVDPDSVDPFTLEEYQERKEPTLFFIPLEIVRRFDPPKELNSPVEGRRESPIVDLDQDVVEKADELPDPISIRDLSNDELKRAVGRVDRIYSTHFKGNDSITHGGFNREDVVNSMIFLLEETTRREVDVAIDSDLAQEVESLGKVEKVLPDGTGKTAPIRSGSDLDLPEVRLEEVTKFFEKPMKIRSPLVYLVGSICNDGVTKNDIDVLTVGPIDEGMRRVIEFRLGRSLPPEVSKRMSFLHDPEMGGPFTNHVPLFDLVLVPHAEGVAQIVEMSDLMKADDPLMDLPKDKGPKRLVFQYHFRGRTLHGDLRFKIADYLIGWTNLIQKSGIPSPKNVSEARDMAKTFDPTGSQYTKPFLAPDGVQATPKKRQPVDWMHVEGEFIEPGEVGATRNLPGLIVNVPDVAEFVEWGTQEPYFHEYFLTGDSKAKMVGRMMYRLLSGSTQGETDLPFWRMFLSKDNLPAILNRRSVNEKRMPPKGYSWMPTTLEKVTPKEFQFWEESGEKAREIRDALVDERFFTTENVQIVEGKFARVEVEKKVFMTVPDGMTPMEFLKAAEKSPFVLSYQAWKGQTVVRAGPSREVWHLVMKIGGKVVDFQLQTDPTENSKVTAIRVPMKGDSLLSLEGEVKPGESYQGDVLNETKATDSFIRIQAKGTATILEEGPGLIRFQVQGGPMRGVHLLEAEEDGGSIWIYQESEGPGQMRKAIPMQGDVQVWDPKKIPAGADRTNDRLKFRPPAFIKPMKVPATSSTQFNSMDDMIEKFATPANLREGIVVEPKWNGFRLEGQTWDEGTLLYTEDEWRDLSSVLPGLAKELSGLGSQVALDGEGMAVDEDGKVVPRRDLARFHGKSPVDDGGFRWMVFNALYLPRGGNLLSDGYLKQKEKLSTFLRGKDLKRIVLTPHRVAHTREELRQAVSWAAKQEGSEGAMFKLADSTYSLGGENHGWAKLKFQRTILAIVYGKDPVEGLSGVWNYSMAVGPVSDPEKWKETVEVKGKTFTIIGQTGNSKVKADVGDVLPVDVLELLFERDAKGRQRLHWFGPPAVSGEVVDSKPFSTEKVIGLLERTEFKKHVDAVLESSRILKAEEGTNDDQRICFGEVLVPNIGTSEKEDTQGDTYSKQDVEDACYWFMENAGRHGFMHQEFVDGKVVLLENYLAPVDMKLKDMDGGMRVIPKGTWLMKLRILDDELWEGIKSGELTGFSIGGTGERTRVE